MTSKSTSERQTENYSLEQKLFMAIFKSDYAAVKYLLDKGSNVNALSPAGHTPLGTAAERGLTDIVKLLLDHKPNPKSCQDDDDGRDSSEEFSAAVQDAAETVIAKKNRGSFIMVHNEEGEPDIAVQEENEDIATGRPFDLNEAVTPDDMDKLEWDFEDVESDDDDDDKDKGAWHMMYRYLGCTSAHLNDTSKCLVNQVDSHGRTAVHYAASEGHVETLKVLIKAGAFVEVRDKNNITPLHLAAERNQPAVVSMLLSRPTGPWNYSPDLTEALHSAAFRGCTPVVDLLLHAKVDINAKDEYGRTPLWVATCGNQYSVLDLLLRRGAKVNIEDQRGLTPLSCAVKMRHDKLAKRLLEAGARVTQSDRLLHAAVLSRQPELARQLVKAGAVTNIRDDNGDTPLILASRIGHIELADILIKGHAVVNYPNSVSGVRPLHVAVECLRESQFPVFRDLVHLLRQGGARLDFESSTTGDTPLIRALIFEKTKFTALLVKLGANVNQAPLYPCRIDIWTLLRRSGHVPLVQLFVAAGLRPRPRDSASSPEKNTVDAWLKYASINPMSLAGQCRIVIRNRYKDRINEVVAASKLPKSVKKFLMFADIPGFTDTEYDCV